MEFILFLLVALLFLLHVNNKFDSLSSRLSKLERSGGEFPTKTFSTPAQPASQPISQNPVMPAQRPAVVSQPIEKTHKSSEIFVGSKIFTFIGVFAILLGAGFFLRYAFANDLISEAMRVWIGIIFGIVLAVIGWILRSKYPGYGLSLIGGGFGAIYLSLYASFAFYSLISPPLAFILLTALTILGVAISLITNSQRLVSFMLIGGYIMPFLLPVFENVHLSFIYLIILSGIVLAISFKKNWPYLSIVSLALVFLILFKFLDPDLYSKAITPLLYTVLLYLFYVVAGMNNLLNAKGLKMGNAMMTYAPPIFFFLNACFYISSANFGVLSDNKYIAFVGFGIALFYIVLALVVKNLFEAQENLTNFFKASVLIASSFVVIGTAAYFEGNVLAYLLIIEALLVVSLGTWMKLRAQNIIGIIIYVLSSLVCLGQFMTTEAETPILSERTFLALVYVLVSFGIFYLFKNKNNQEFDENKVGAVLSAIGFVIAPFIWIITESDTFKKEGDVFQNSLMFWNLLVLIYLSLGIWLKDKVFRYSSYILFGLAGFFTLASFSWRTGNTMFFNERIPVVVAFVIVSILIYLMLRKSPETVASGEYKTLRKPIVLLGNGALVWLGSLEIIDYFSQQIPFAANGAEIDSLNNAERFSLSAFWLIYAFVSSVVGMVKKSGFVRQLSLLLFAITILKIFLIDTTDLSDIYRFFSFMTLGLILLVVGFLYYKYRNVIAEWIKGEA